MSSVGIKSKEKSQQIELLTLEGGEINPPSNVYPLNWISNTDAYKNIHNQTNADNQEHNKEQNVYPDFEVWRQSAEENEIMKTHLQKGYYQSPVVKHEDQSGRPLMAEILNKEESTKKRKLRVMGQVFIDAMHRRSVFNSIKNRESYKPPPRVTLTEHKKEIWLQRLADKKNPLKDISRAIPHGLRNKYLLEQCLSHNIPITRAIWLIKCISSNEQRHLKRKNASISKWVVEWTEQVTSFLEFVIESCFQDNTNWRNRFNYAIVLVVNLYSDELMNRIIFLTWIVRFTSHIVTKASTFEDLRELLVHQSIIKLFWFKIIVHDYLTKELSESMLMILAKISQLSKGTKFDVLSQKITDSFQYLIKYLFYYNSDIFILPSNWSNLKPHLRKTLDMNLPPVYDQFNLISYRNETLTIDESAESSCSDIIPNDKTSLILNKLNNLESESIQSISKMIFEDMGSNWRQYIDMLFEWSIQSFSDSRISQQRISLICSILQFRLLQLIQSKSKRYKSTRSELENKVIDFVHSMSEIINYKTLAEPQGEFFDISSFLILINKLYVMKLFIVSSYLRRLIASGVIYLSEPDRTCYIHILILNSLPVSDPNLVSILKRLIDSTKLEIPCIKNKDLIKQERVIHIDSIFKNDNIGTITFTSDPMYIGEQLELDSFTYFEFESRLKNEELNLKESNLNALYELFSRHPSCLSKFFISIMDGLDSGTVKIDSAETMCLLCKMIFMNSKLLKCSIFSIKMTILDLIYKKIKEWGETNKFNIIASLIRSGTPIDLIPCDINVSNVSVGEEFLKPEELAILEVGSYERLSTSAEFTHYTTLAITKYVNSVRAGVSDFLIVRFLKSLQRWKQQEFEKCVHDYIFRFIKPTLQLEYDINLKVLVKMVCDELFDFKNIIGIFENSGDIFDTQEDKHILWDLLFNVNEGVVFQFARWVYIHQNANDYFKILRDMIFASFKVSNSKVDSTGTPNDVDLMDSFEIVKPFEIGQLNGQVVDAFWSLVNEHRNIFLELFYDTSVGTYEVEASLKGFIFGRVLKIPDDDIFRHLTYFNLPIMQWAFTKTFKENNIEGIIEQLAVVRGLNEKLVGELFAHLQDDVKYDMLITCEEKYLNSEAFPKVIVYGVDITKFVGSIIGSCSRFHSRMKMEMGDATFFALTSGLEKLINLCNHGNKRDLECGVKMVSKIILLHRYFIVEHVLRRSIHLQRDVFIQSLMKLFNHKMMYKDLKLKNLLYDVLMSIKVIISECLTQQLQRKHESPTQGRDTPTNLNANTNLSAGTNPASASNNTPPSNSGYIIMPNILNVKPPSFNNSLRNLLEMFDMKDTVREHDTNLLFTVNQHWDGTIGGDEPLMRYERRPFDEIEGGNESSVNISLFGVVAKRENPR